MKTLELNNYGVQEMNAMEMREMNGGALFPIILGIVLVVAAIVDYVQDGKLDGHIDL